MGYPVTDGRDTERPLIPIGLRDHDSFNRGRFVRLVFQCFAQFRQKGGLPFSFLDVLEGDAVDSGAPSVGADKIIGMTEDVRPMDLVIQGVKTAGRLLLGLEVELPLKCPDAFRSW